jgi:hypothetical protein
MLLRAHPQNFPFEICSTRHAVRHRHVHFGTGRKTHYSSLLEEIQATDLVRVTGRFKDSALAGAFVREPHQALLV